MGAWIAGGCAADEPAPRAGSGDPSAPVPPFTVLARWEDPSSIRVAVDPARSPLAADELEGALTRALAAWSSAGPVGFSRAEASADPASVDLLVRWTDGSDPAAPGLGRDTSVAATRNACRREGPGPCELFLDAGRAWEAPDLEAALVHELGHALGLGHVEVEGSALHPQRELAAPRPGPVDVAGLRSLYGPAAGPEMPGDLSVRSGGERALVLRAVAPPGRSAWALFDTDGDGDDELLVWATGPGDGALTAYHFEPGPRGPLLARTGGPYLGTAGYGAELVPWVAPDGTRRLDVAWPDGSSVRRRLDERGVPLPPRPGEAGERALRPRPPASDLGDLDGDGVAERVEALAPAER